MIPTDWHNIMKGLRLAGWIMLLLVGACDTYEPPLYSGPEFVNFDARETSIREEGGTAKIRVNLGGELSISPIKVDYIVSPNDNAVALFQIKDEGSVTIAGGKGFAEIEITPIDNNLPDGEKIVELTISNLNGQEYNIGFPGPDALNSTISIRIIDDDCPLDRDFITGTVVETADDIIEEGEDPAAQPPIFSTVTIVADTDPENPRGIIINDFWGFTGSTLTLTLDPCPEEVTIFSSDIIYNDPQDGPLEVIPTGSGTYDPVSGIMTLELTLDVQFGSFGDWKFTYKK